MGHAEGMIDATNSRTGTIHPWVSNFINFSRWASAFVVLVSHSRQLSMCDWDKVNNKGLIQKLFYLVTQMGHEAVMVFFVISGYLIGGNAIARLHTGFDSKSYAIHRFSRIYAAFFPALILGGTLDLLGARIFPESLIYSGTLKIVSLPNATTMTTGIVSFIGNAAMLQTVFVKPFGTNGPLWSLAAEWWYYCLFGAAMIVATNSNKLAKAISAFFFLVVIIILPLETTLMGLMWLIGAGAAVYSRSNLRIPSFTFTAPAFLLWLLFARLTHTSEFSINFAGRLAVDFITALTYSGLLISAHNIKKYPRFTRLNIFLADFSFSLYLVHFPIIVFVSAIFYSQGLNVLQQPSPTSTAYFTALVLFSIIIAFIFSRLTEAKTSNLRRTVEMIWKH